jgi:hypothetical protein
MTLKPQHREGRRMDRALTWFINGWFVVAALVNITAIIGLFIGAGGFWTGWLRVTHTFSPFNFINWVAELVLLSPALAAIYWREKRANRV